MIVKYYGYNEMVNFVNRPAIETFQYTTDIYPGGEYAKVLNDLNPSYCIWLVPGTIDVNGDHIPIETN